MTISHSNAYKMNSSERQALRKYWSGKIGRRLKEIRRRLELSQAEVATMVGLTYQQIQKYEKGENIIPAPVLLLLSQQTDINIEEFFNF